MFTSELWNAILNVRGKVVSAHGTEIPKILGLVLFDALSESEFDGYESTSGAAPDVTFVVDWGHQEDVLYPMRHQMINKLRISVGKEPYHTWDV